MRADVCYRKLLGLGYEGSERTVRRAVAGAKREYRKAGRRVYRPWITEPGMWAQWDWGEGPAVDGKNVADQINSPESIIQIPHPQGSLSAYRATPFIRYLAACA